MEAIKRLDERAASSVALEAVRELLPKLRQNRKPEFWKDPEYIKQSIDVAKALYACRRLSWSEYVFNASITVESAHDDKCFKGEYEDLGAITRAMDVVSERHGLGANESFYLRDAPAEYRDLNDQWEAAAEAHLVRELRRFGLEELATLRETNRTKYDEARERGRRATFHKDDHAHAIRDIVIQYEEDAHRAAATKAYAAAVTLLGAGIEGLLLLRCLRAKPKAIRVAKRLPRRVRPRYTEDLMTWTFEALIAVCLEAGWLPRIETSVAVYNSAGLADQLRAMRNHVHPARRAREKPWSEVEERDYADAESIYRLLRPILTGQIRRPRRERQS